MRGMTQEREEKIPRACEITPHADRARLDLLRKEGDDPRVLTDHERAVGHVRPLWHSFQHVTCGTISSIRFHDAADILAREPQRMSFRAKGLRCPCDNEHHPIFGDLQGRKPEMRWVDTAGVVTDVWVGE